MTWDKERYANDPEYRGNIQKTARRWREANRPKLNAQKRERYADNPRPPEVSRRIWLRQTYGITPEIYEAMVARQKGLCALCRRRPIKRLYVDHSHDTRKLRQLLCLGCNTGFGCFGDDPDMMQRGADYLKIWRIIHSWEGPGAIKPIPKKKSSKPRKERKAHDIQHSPARGKQGQWHDAPGHPAGAALSAKRRGCARGGQVPAGRAQPGQQAGARRRVGDQGGARPHRRQDPAGRPRKR